MNTNNAFEQLSLFGEETPTNKSAKKVNTKESNIVSQNITDERGTKKTLLSPVLQEYVKYYLERGFNSALQICDLLISENKTADKRFSTLKPTIYPEVCMFLEELVTQGECQFIEERENKTDRIYIK